MRADKIEKTFKHNESSEQSDHVIRKMSQDKK